MPEDPPFIALAFGAALIRRTVVVVTTEELSATGGVVVVGVSTRLGRCVGTVVDGVTVVVGVDLDAIVVVTGDFEEGRRDEAPGPLAGAPDVRVKTRTTRSIGLDHIKRCVLFSEKCARAIVFEG
jgi:hypothetical protein